MRKVKLNFDIKHDWEEIPDNKDVLLKTPTRTGRLTKELKNLLRQSSEFYNKLDSKDDDRVFNFKSVNMFGITKAEYTKLVELVEKHNRDLEFNKKFNKLLE